MHQIRIHLVCLKAPIVADALYGGQDVYLSQIKRRFKLKQDTEEQALIKRVALHAYSLSYPSPTGERIEIHADYPKDFAVLVRQLEINS